MTKLKNYSIQKLLNIDKALTKLLYYTMDGIESGGHEINSDHATALADLINHQTDIQEVIYEKLKNLLEPCEFEDDILINNDMDTQ